MKRVSIPNPPNPMDAQYVKNTLAYERAVYDWMTRVKGALESCSAVNDTPCAQNIVVGSYATETAVSGTSTGTDLANAVCTITAALTTKGILSPTTSK